MGPRPEPRRTAGGKATPQRANDRRYQSAVHPDRICVAVDPDNRPSDVFLTRPCRRRTAPQRAGTIQVVVHVVPALPQRLADRKFLAVTVWIPVPSRTPVDSTRLRARACAVLVGAGEQGGSGTAAAVPASRTRSVTRNGPRHSWEMSPRRLTRSPRLRNIPHGHSVGPPKLPPPQSPSQPPLIRAVALERARVG